MVGSNRSLRSARNRASVRSSSAAASLLYPATSAARMAASLRASAMAVPVSQRRVARLIPYEAPSVGDVGLQVRMGCLLVAVDFRTSTLHVGRVNQPASPKPLAWPLVSPALGG